MDTADTSQCQFASNPVVMPGHNCRDYLRKLGLAQGSGQFRSQLFTILQCQHCGVGLTEPVPTEETAHTIYETRESNDFQPNDPKLVSLLKRAIARRDIRRFCQDAKSNGRFLDYGCGDGTFVRAIQDVFPDGGAFGSDMHTTPPALLDERAYIPYDKLSTSEFDFILLRHVLEHSYRPVDLVSHLKSLLRPNGVLAIEVPSLETKVKTLFGKYWDGYYVPYHPLHFTRGSLIAVLKAAGFSIIRVGGAEMPKIGRSIQHALGCEYNLGLFSIGVLLQPLQIAIGWVTGTTVCLRLWARNSSEV